MDEKDQTISKLQMELETHQSAAREQEKLVLEGYNQLDDMLREVEEQRNKLQNTNDSLSRAMEFIDRLVNTMSEGLILLGLDGKIERVNKILLDRLDLAEEEVIGANPDNFFDKNDIVRSREMLPTTIKDNGTAEKSVIYHLFSELGGREQELRMVDRAGNPMDHLFRGSLLYNTQGKKEGVVLIGTDIRELKKVQQNLEEANKKVNRLKEHQDGDYFLISLILQPLQMNENSSEKVSTNFYLEQKKKFFFKGQYLDIGGDICISGDINLNDRRFIFFCNADAMGKSMQGAGGALVFGSIVNSLVKRTFVNQHNSDNISLPSQWLYNAFRELNNFFLPFGGSMMISAVMGLIDEENGLLYYFNAEHPWSVLYRNGKAVFIEKELTLRKIGMPVTEFKSFRIKKIQLYPGDVLITGSDGRDDLILDTKSDGEAVINEDEQLFLQMVKKSEANLDGLVRRIHNTGQVTDDLSLVRIAYHGSDRGSNKT